MRKLDVMGLKPFEAAAAKVSIQEQLRPGRAARKPRRADWPRQERSL